MHRFQVRPADASILSPEIVASNPAGVLQMVQELNCKEADVLRDGEYCVSVRLEETGLWCIFHRDRPHEPHIVPFG